MTQMSLLINMATGLFLNLPNVGGLPPAGARIPGCYQNHHHDDDEDDDDRDQDHLDRIVGSIYF